MLCFKHLLIISLTICFGNCAKILGIFPLATYSEWLQGHRLLTELAKRGHEVTMISAYELKEPIPNYRNIYVQEAKFENFGTYFNFNHVFLIFT